MRTCPFGVDHPLGNPFPVEFGKFVEQVVVLEEDWAVLAGCEGVLVVVYGVAEGSGELAHMVYRENIQIYTLGLDGV